MLIKKSLLKEYIIKLLKEGYKEPNPEITVISYTRFIQPIFRQILLKIVPAVFDEIIQHLSQSDIDFHIRNENFNSKIHLNNPNTVNNIKAQLTDEIIIKNEILTKSNLEFIESLDLVDPDFEFQSLNDELNQAKVNKDAIEKIQWLQDRINNFNPDDYDTIAPDFIRCDVLFYIDEISLSNNTVDMDMSNDIAGSYLFNGFEYNDDDQLYSQSYLSINLKNALSQLFKDYLKITQDNNLDSWENFINSNISKFYTLAYLRGTIRHELEHFYQNVNQIIQKLKRLYTARINDNVALPDISDEIEEFLLDYEKSGRSFENISNSYLFPQSSLSNLKNAKYDKYGYDYQLFSEYDPSKYFNLPWDQSTKDFLSSRKYLYDEAEIIPQLNDLVYTYVNAAKSLFVDADAAAKWLFKFFGSDDFVYIRQLEHTGPKSREIQKYLLKTLQAKDVIFENPFKISPDLGFVRSNLKPDILAVIENLANELTFSTNFEDAKYVELFNNSYLQARGASSRISMPNNREISKDEWRKDLKTFSTEIRMQLYKKIQKVWNYTEDKFI